MMLYIKWKPVNTDTKPVVKSAACSHKCQAPLANNGGDGSKKPELKPPIDK